MSQLGSFWFANQTFWETTKFPLWSSSVGSTRSTSTDLRIKYWEATNEMESEIEVRRQICFFSLLEQWNSIRNQSIIAVALVFNCSMQSSGFTQWISMKQNSHEVLTKIIPCINTRPREIQPSNWHEENKILFIKFVLASVCVSCWWSFCDENFFSFFLLLLLGSSLDQHIARLLNRCKHLLIFITISSVSKIGE